MSHGVLEYWNVGNTMPYDFYQYSRITVVRPSHHQAQPYVLSYRSQIPQGGVAFQHWVRSPTKPAAIDLKEMIHKP